MANRTIGDGSDVEIIGAPRRIAADVYHFLLGRSWWRLIGSFVNVYLVVNVLFGTAYWLVGGVANAREGSWRDAFFFSVQTIGTIGYGAMYPVSSAAQTLVLLESIVGILLIALVTGLVFSKFSRPISRLRFTHQMTITPVDGVPTLIFRCANDRGNHVVEATVTVVILRRAPSAEGVITWRSEDLRLVRNRSSAFTRTWTVLHTIDSTSPLYGATPESLVRDDVEIMVSLMGMDSMTSQMIHGNTVYDGAADIRFGVRHADMITELPNGRYQLDLSRFDLLVPVDGNGAPTASS